ncbi:MAG: type II toxin-antitoxin system VapC family toxin [Proteobacteria bacterium]|nr:type II toxin-antitoxin system VapC family toxin [Pseudomonadota bacterium]
MFLLDTDTIIYILNGNHTAVRNLNAHLNDPINISAISLMELYYGAHKSQKVSSNLAKVRKLEKTIRIIPVGAEVSEIVGLLKANLENEGNRLDDFDLVIAASALTHNLILVTNNLAHYSRIEGLKLENWT